jgi:transcriptional regulator with XRE-family HTH domain
MTQTDGGWASAWSARIGKRIQVKRRRQHMTADQLAARTAELGYEVTRSTIANIESGRRDVVTVQQVTVIAMALDTSPVVLLFDPTDPVTDLLPGDAMSGIEASEWWSGNWRALHLRTHPGERVVTNPDMELYTYRKVFQLHQMLRKALADLDKLQALPLPGPTYALEVETAKYRVSKAAEYLAGSVGGHRPHLPADAVTALDQLAERGLFTWPEDLIAQMRAGRGPVEPWPGDLVEDD